MSRDAFELAVFVLLWSVIAIVLYPRFDVSFLRQGKQVHLSRSAIIAIFSGVVLACLGASYYFVYLAGPHALQRFYVAVYPASWVATFFFLLSARTVVRRLLLSVGLAAVVLLVTFAFPTQFVQNCCMAGSLLWIGPVVAKRFSVPLKIAVGVLFLAMAIDIYNVFFFVHTGGGFSDTDFFLNGLIVVGDRIFGVGDVFLMSLVLALTQRRFGAASAVLLAVITTFPIVGLRWFVPSLSGVTIPYYMILVPVTLFLWLLFFLKESAADAS